MLSLEVVIELLLIPIGDPSSFQVASGQHFPHVHSFGLMAE